MPARIGDRPRTAAEQQAKYRDKRRQKMEDLETLAADLVRMHIEIKEVPATEKGRQGFGSSCRPRKACGTPWTPSASGKASTLRITWKTSAGN